MAASKSYFARSNYRFLPGDYHHHHHHTAVAAADAAAFELDESDIYNSARSNSPEFRKSSSSSSSRLISKKAASKRSSGDPCGDRTGATVASLPEGIGRTLKGRDLSRVRNAIWEKTGFED
ncbi:hypothetical protein TIFTF001_000695 [Ficus carica]|uniref:Senescence regulator n=1 Tax=Ficus carica TaxID=3494 RepID=A0AA88CPP6_FICCA|nr:hypothetical protein TIFTF001_000695 [Ficus carica]